MSLLQSPPNFQKTFNEPSPPPYHVRHYILTLLVLLAVLIVLLFIPYVTQQIAYSITRGRELARAEVAGKELRHLPAKANRYALVAKIIEPSVVGIQTTIQVSSPFFDADGFEQGIRATTQGSGVIVDPSGYILTNAHVISQAPDGMATVQLSDGQIFSDAAIIGVDPATDLAILKIDASGLTAAHWGDSDALQVGDPVLAVGSPYGLTETVTAGIISAKNRKVGIENVRYEDFLQTDAAVNPGNSGGPLVNMNAEVVGINTAIVGHTNQGIGFSIPSNLARKVYDLLRTTGIPRGWIGVDVQDLTPALADRFHLKKSQGALVARVRDHSPADQAGIAPGDVIVRWDRNQIDNSNDLRIAIAKSKPGAQATAVLYRDGRKQEVPVTVAERPNQISQ
jgi:serine protease Do